MTKTTRWSPDTCGCIIDYDWDPTAPEGARVHTLNNVVETCPDHTGLAGAGLYTACTDENTRKNIALEMVRAIMPDVDTNDDAPREYEWDFTGQGNRPLRVRVSRLTGQQRAQWQQDLNARFGPGKATVRA